MADTRTRRISPEKPMAVAKWGKAPAGARAGFDN